MLPWYSIVNGYYYIRGVFYRFPEKGLDWLCLSVSDEEVKAAVFEMMSLKAPSIDGVHA